MKNSTENRLERRVMRRHEQEVVRLLRDMNAEGHECSFDRAVQ